MSTLTSRALSNIARGIVLAVLLLSVANSAQSQGKDKKTTKPTTAKKDSLGTEGTVVKPKEEPTTEHAIRAATAPKRPPLKSGSMVGGAKAPADLVISEIKQDLVDYNTRYRVQFTVKNQGGTATNHEVDVEGGWIEPMASIPDPLVFFGNNEGDHFVLPPLAPGETRTFHLPAKHLVSETIDVLVSINNYNGAVVESNLRNNTATKILGPH